MNILDMKFKGQMIACKTWVVGGLVKRAKNQDGVTVPVGIKQDGCNTVEVIPESIGFYVGNSQLGADLFSGDIIKDPSNGDIWIIKFDPAIGATLALRNAEGEVGFDEVWPLEDWALFCGNIHD